MLYKLSKKLTKIVKGLILIQLFSITLMSLANEIYLWDEVAYILNGMEIAHKLTNPVMQQYVAHERHLLLSWITAALCYLNVPLMFYNLISPISLVLFSILMYKMGEKLYNRDVGLISAFILVSIPAVIYLSTKVMTDIPGTLLFSMCLYFYYLGLEKPKYFLLGGLIGGISIVMKDMNFLLIPIMFVFTLAFRMKISFKYYVSSILVGFISTLPYFIDNFYRWGDPFYRIVTHVKLVNEGIGYHSLPLQDISFSWLIFLPIFIGIPIFCLFVSNLYKKRKEIFSNPNLRFLLIWFSVPFIIFLFGQKIEYRLSFIFLPPVLLIGSNELLSKNKTKFKALVLLILLFNGFPLSDILIFNLIRLSKSREEVFNFIERNIPSDEKIFSNADPPSLVALHTNRTVVYSVSPEFELELKYYLHEKTFSEYLTMFQKTIQVNSSNYKIIFNNSLYTLYQKV